MPWLYSMYIRRNHRESSACDVPEHGKTQNGGVQIAYPCQSIYGSVHDTYCKPYYITTFSHKRCETGGGFVLKFHVYLRNTAPASYPLSCDLSTSTSIPFRESGSAPSSLMYFYPPSPASSSGCSQCARKASSTQTSSHGRTPCGTPRIIRPRRRS
ncbi:hypothetical protein C8Q70DRAFT_627532 [Cubamyces menziesii]|nr:hypothetical protein C8Q70DRAFT_627532 [Cubamyces menziesii]